MRAGLFSLICLSASAPALLAQSQLEMNQAAGNEFAAADKKLNSVYQQILRKYAKNPLFLKYLKTAQRLWVQFRDAQLAMKFPDREPGFYGSVLPMCKSNYLAELTVDRTKQLEEWLKPRTEGDVCSGSLGEFDAD